MSLIHKLSDLLGCKPSLLTFSGIKDKVAITAQEVTVRGIRAERSEGTNLMVMRQSRESSMPQVAVSKEETS